MQVCARQFSAMKAGGIRMLLPQPLGLRATGAWKGKTGLALGLGGAGRVALEVWAIPVSGDGAGFSQTIRE